MGVGTPIPEAPIRVTITPHEKAMVNMAVALVDGSDPRMHAPKVARPSEPTGLSHHAMQAIRRVIGRGTARLAIGRAGRPWRDAPPMAFGCATLDLLAWLHATPVVDPQRPPLVLRSKPTTAEQLLICRAIEMVDAAGGRPPQVASRSIWAWLLHGERLARFEVEPVPVDLDRLHDEEWLLVSMQPQLLSAWSAWCRATRKADLKVTIRHGKAQHAIGTALARYWSSAPDRLAFLGELAVELGPLPPNAWTTIRGEHLITTWLQASRARVAIPKLLVESFGRWGDAWRATGFVDDGYDQAQRWLSQFDRPLQAMGRLREVVNRAESLREIG